MYYVVLDIVILQIYYSHYLLCKKSTMPRLPSNMTEQESLTLLQRIWAKYYPEEDQSFLSHMMPEDVHTMLEIIHTPDPDQQAKIWEGVAARIHTTDVVMHTLLQRATHIKDEYIEAVDRS